MGEKRWNPTDRALVPKADRALKKVMGETLQGQEVVEERNFHGAVPVGSHLSLPTALIHRGHF